MKKTKKKNDHKDKFTYKPGDLKIIKAKKIKESYSSFAEFLSEKEEKFVASTMRWITIKDEQDRNQHILIKKKDGTILGGMGGTHNGEKLKDVFKDLEAERKEIEKKEAKPYAKSKYDEIDPPFRERFAREMRVAKKVEELYYSHGDPISENEVHSDKHRLSRKDLDSSEISAIEYYTADGYADMNSILRNYNEWVEVTRANLRDEAVEFEGLEDEEEIEQYIDYQMQEKESIAEEYIDELANAFRGFETKANMKTYRGLAKNYMDEIRDGLKVGDVLEDKGYVSTSTDIETAERFGEYVMEVLIPKGSRASSVDHLTSTSGESEVLIDAGAKFEVTEINHEKKKLVVLLIQDKED